MASMLCGLTGVLLGTALFAAGFWWGRRFRRAAPPKPDERLEKGRYMENQWKDWLRFLSYDGSEPPEEKTGMER